MIKSYRKNFTTKEALNNINNKKKKLDSMI